MWTGAFPEPRTFGIRALREMRARQDDFDVVHDNQVLASGMLKIAEFLPLVTSIHHPISVDRRIELTDGPRLLPADQVALVLLRPDAGAGRAQVGPGHDRL